jgi:hypothetical protein
VQRESQRPLRDAEGPAGQWPACCSWDTSPGTALYQQARENGWLPEYDAALIDERGVQAAALSYPNRNRTEIYDSVESFYRQFYFRAGKIAEMSAEMLRSPGMMRRRLREGAEFISFLRRRDSSAS